MKNSILVLILFHAISCKEDEPVVSKSHVKYEVLASSGLWVGEYIVGSGEKLCTCDESSPLKPSGWIYEFDVTTKPFVLHIDASTDCICRGDVGAPDITTNIYVNNVLVESNSHVWAPGVVSSDYIIE